MNHFIINLSDSKDFDQQIAVDVEQQGDIGHIAQLAIDELLVASGKAVVFPLFVDIHRAEVFPEFAGLYPRTESDGGPPVAKGPGTSPEVAGRRAAA